MHTEKTSGLVRELLTKLDSADVYAARKEAQIEASKKQIGRGSNYRENYSALLKVANQYAHYSLDSSLVYFEKAAQVAKEAEDEFLIVSTDIRLSTMLTIGGFYMAAAEILNSVPRKALRGVLRVPYYNAWMSLYREVYSSSYEPDAFKKEYNDRYVEYRDSLICVADTMGVHYLRNMERKEAKAGNYAEARRYNAIRMANTPDQKSYAYATCLYDRFMISYH